MLLFRRFITSSGKLVLAGKDAKSNEELISGVGKNEEVFDVNSALGRQIAFLVEIARREIEVVGIASADIDDVQAVLRQRSGGHVIIARAGLQLGDLDGLGRAPNMAIHGYVSYCYTRNVRRSRIAS